MTRTIKVAAVQAHTLSTTRETLQALEGYAVEAAEKGVGLALFPEAYLGGYPRTCTFGSSIGAREEVGRDQFLRYFESAVDLGDTVAGAEEAWAQRRLPPVPSGVQDRGDGTREELERIAETTGVFLVVGLIEKAASTMFCSVVFVHPEQGMLQAKRRKVMPTGTERLVWAQASTATLKAVTTTIQGVQVTLGSAICWENYMPLLRYSLYAQNVQIWLAPTADGRESWLPLLQTIAAEGRAFVVSSNQVVRQSELPGWVASARLQKVPKSRSLPKDPTEKIFKRRHLSFCQTDSGHEICLGSVAGEDEKEESEQTATSASPTRSVSPGTIRSKGDSISLRGRARRKSSIYRIADGHDLVIPSKVDATLASSTIDSTAKQPHLRRESSTIPLHDGHEICFTKGHDGTNGHGSEEAAIAQSEDGELSVDAAIPEEEDDDDALVSRGGSCIVSPFGQVLAERMWDKTGMVISDCDIDECVRGKLDFDVAGHYSRSDSFKLTVDGLDLS